MSSVPPKPPDDDSTGTVSEEAVAASSGGIESDSKTIVSAIRPARTSLKEQAAGLPSTPGVYLFKNERGTVLYVGKAQSLKSRVRQYVSGGDGRYQIPALIDRAASRKRCFSRTS